MPRHVLVRAISRSKKSRKEIGDDAMIKKSSKEATKSTAQLATKKSEEKTLKHGTRKMLANTKNRTFEKSIEQKKRKVGKPNPAIWKKKEAEMLQRKGIAPTRAAIDVDKYNPKMDPDPFLWVKVGSGLQVEVAKESDEVSVLTECTSGRESSSESERETDEFEFDDDLSVDSERKRDISGVSQDMQAGETPGDVIEC